MRPLGILVCGPPGVGKTSHFKQMLSNAGITEDVFLIDPDMRSELSSNERSIGALKDVKDAIDRKIHFGYTATCGSMRVVYELIDRMKAANYRTIVAVVYASLPVALERIQKRLHQQTPSDVVHDLHSFFKTKAERFMKLPVEIYLYNNETDFNLLFSKKNRHIVCRNKESDFYFDISNYCSRTS